MSQMAMQPGTGHPSHPLMGVTQDMQSVPPRKEKPAQRSGPRLSSGPGTWARATM